MIKTNLNELKAAIEKIEKVVPKKPALPILKTVNFKTINNNTLQLYASDIEQFTTISIPCVTDEQLNINIDVTTIKRL